MKQAAIAALLALLAPHLAGAEVGNPNLLPFGEEEAFLGNAGIAHAGSAGATYYNPGALGFLRSRRLSVYGNGYIADQARVTKGIRFEGVDLPISSGSFSPVPLSSVSVFTGEHATYAFSIHLPDNLQYDFQVPHEQGPNRLNWTGSTSKSNLWLGPSLGAKAGERWAWGASLFAIRRAESYSSFVYLEKTSAPTFDGAIGRHWKATAWSALLVLGAQWEASESWRLGLRLQSPSLSLRGRMDYLLVAEGTMNGSPLSQLQNRRGLHYRYELPAQAGLGAQYSPRSGLSLLLDLNAQLPVAYNTAPANPTFGTSVRTRLRARANAGAKLRLTEDKNLLLGFAYNPSASVTDPNDVNQLDDEDFKGVTAGLQVDTGKLVTAAGAFFLWANGEWRQGDILDSRVGTSSISHRIYGALLTASYKL